jgi:pimeloyl-ACP methyl ester carboxylesterase
MFTDVCVKFASIQPAPKGNLAVHCGGPGSLSLGADSVDQYNVISFDQRGMGQSEPTFGVDECNITTYDTQLVLDLVNLNDEESIRADAQVYKARALGCWAYEGFQLKSKTKSGM